MRNFLTMEINLRPHSSNETGGESTHSNTATTVSHSDSTNTGIRFTAPPKISRRLSMERDGYRDGGEGALRSSIRSVNSTRAIGDQLQDIDNAATPGNVICILRNVSFKYTHRVTDRAENNVSFSRYFASSYHEVTNTEEKNSSFPR